MDEHRTESHQKGLLKSHLTISHCVFFNAFNPYLLSAYYVHYETSNYKTWFFNFFFQFFFNFYLF